MAKASKPTRKVTKASATPAGTGATPAGAEAAALRASGGKAILVPPNGGRTDPIEYGTDDKHFVIALTDGILARYTLDGKFIDRMYLKAGVVIERAGGFGHYVVNEGATPVVIMKG